MADGRCHVCGEPAKDGHPCIRPAWLSDQQIAAKYDVVRHLGSGGMGQTFLVRNRLIGYSRVLKSILKQRINEEYLRRFHDEAKAATRVRHDNIAQIYDFFECSDGTPVTDWEHVDGPSLRDALTKEKFELSRALQLSIRVLDGLEAIHQHMVHRDIKPANLMLTSGAAELKIIDFGLAKIHGATANTTEPIGTAHYLPPEAWDMKPERLRPTADIFAAGAVLYELITLRKAFDGANQLQVMNRIFREEPPWVGPLDPGLPAARPLITIIKRSVAKSPADRYQTAADFRKDLMKVIADGSAEATLRRAHSARPRRSSANTKHQFLRRRCRVMPGESLQFQSLIRSLLSHEIEQTAAEDEFQKSWLELAAGYERTMARAAFCENSGNLKEMRDTLEQNTFPDPTQDNVRLLYLALAHEKLNDLARAETILRRVLETERHPAVTRAAQFNIHVCHEKRDPAAAPGFEPFLGDHDVVFVDGERLSDKALAMQMILSIQNGNRFLYQAALNESLAFLAKASKTGYIKTLLTSVMYEEKSELTQPMIDMILGNVAVLDAESRFAILISLYKCLRRQDSLRRHVLEVIRNTPGKTAAVARWLSRLKE
jgi:serine/threonine protein kinase